jgi:hypothetical protein
MNATEVPLVDIISPVVTFAMVIVLPSLLAVWIMYRNIFESKKTAQLKTSKGHK